MRLQFQSSIICLFIFLQFFIGDIASANRKRPIEDKWKQEEK
jgi:hypothetical protein